MCATFRHVHGLGYTTVTEMLMTMHKNNVFDRFPEFFEVVHILAVYLLYATIFLRQSLPQSKP